MSEWDMGAVAVTWYCVPLLFVGAGMLCRLVYMPSVNIVFHIGRLIAISTCMVCLGTGAWITRSTGASPAQSWAQISSGFRYVSMR
jgi:hypothetical protein